MMISKRTIGKEILLNYITYASENGAKEIDVNDLLEFIEARSVVIANENDKKVQVFIR